MKHKKALLMCVILFAMAEGAVLRAPDDLVRSASADAVSGAPQKPATPLTDKKKSCTNDSQCGEEFSCWYKIPRGPSAGIPGSKKQPGQCWDNEIIKGLR
jgi:hypothetical protein